MISNTTDISALLSLFGASNASSSQNQNSDSASSFADSLNSLIGGSDSSSASSGSSAGGLFGTSSSDFLSLFGSTQGASSAGSKTFAESELNQGGPLPAFLTSIESQLGLSQTQDTSLEQIATQFLDAPGEPNVADVQNALTQAGIPG